MTETPATTTSTATPLQSSRSTNSLPVTAYQSYHDVVRDEGENIQRRSRTGDWRRSVGSRCGRNANNRRSRRRELGEGERDPLEVITAATTTSTQDDWSGIEPSEQQQQQQQEPQEPPPVAEFRGFSTSISAMFQDVRYEGIDSCSLLCCCGVLQSDYNRYVATGISPPSWHRRCHLHFIVPVLLFCLAVYCAGNIYDIYWNKIVTNMIVVMLLLYWISQCCKGRAKRVAVRKELLRLKRHMNDDEDDEEEYDEDDNNNSNHLDVEEEEDEQNLGQTACELNCAHALIGCYPSDIDQNNRAALETTIRNHDNLCSCLWRSLYKRIGCPCCGCWCQCCGMCATAQEGRQIHHMIPWHLRFVDYVTFQPMLDYYPRIYRLRHDMAPNQCSWLWRHLYCSLSHLSKWILKWGVAFLAVLLVWSLLPIFPEHHHFRLENFWVVLGTFGYGAVLMYWIHAMWHMLDLSVDAVIKYYVSGFCLSTSIAIMGEICLSLVVRLATNLMLALSGIDVVVDDSGYSMSKGNNDRSNRPRLVIETTTIITSRWFQAKSSSIFGTTRSASESHQPSYHDYLIAFGNAHPIFYTLYLALCAFIIAALVEEVSKYLGYRMVVHPDWWSRRDVERIHDDQQAHEQYEQRQPQQQGPSDGTTHPSPHHPHRKGSRTGSWRGRGSVAASARDEPTETHSMERGLATTGTSSKRQARDPSDANTTSGAGPWNSALDYALQDRSHVSRGAATTVAMVAVAVGFSCCEDLVYIFLYSGAAASVEMQWAVLLARSLFPVHVLCAALQSIGVVERDVLEPAQRYNNNDDDDHPPLQRQHFTRLGRILWPAILFHGSYDFFIVWVDFLANRRQSIVNAHNAESAESSSSSEALNTAEVISLIISILLEVGALVYYVWASRGQRRRLRAMDEQHAINATNNRTTTTSTIDQSSLL